MSAYLDTHFEALCQAVRNSRQNAGTPFFLNNCDTPVARDAPAFRNFSGPWLHTAYTRNGIDPSHWAGLTEGLFDDLRRTVLDWSVGRMGVVAVDATGRLERAGPNDTGDSADWVNEIHPNKRGWRKQVPAWLDVLPT